MSGCNCGGFEDCHSGECMCGTAAENIRACFRLLWEQHVYWTRLAIIGIVSDLPNTEPTVNRLLRNPADFARVFCYYYGNEISAEVDRLIRDHLVIAGELVKAAKAGNDKLAAATEKRWYANGDEIVCSLNRINPYWSVRQMQAMWYEHLALTKAEAVAELGKDYAKSIKRFNQIEDEALMMADYLANGIICQFQL